LIIVGGQEENKLLFIAESLSVRLIHIFDFLYYFPADFSRLIYRLFFFIIADTFQIMNILNQQNNFVLDNPIFAFFPCIDNFLK